MRVYISGAISGTDNHTERFEEAEKRLIEHGHSVFNPEKVCAQLPEDTQYEEYMTIGISMLDMCEAIYMLNGWRQSRGANREYGYALAKDKVIMYE